MNGFDQQYGRLSALLTMFDYRQSMVRMPPKQCLHVGFAAIVRLTLALITMLAMFFAVPAFAQTVHQYTNSVDTSSGGLNENNFSCTSPLVRTFSVGDTFNVTDVDIGVLAAHTYRADLVMTLEGPDSTIVNLTNGSGGGANNFNVLFDDDEGTSITDHTNADTATATTVVPTYQRTFSPVAALSAFNGKPANGTWTLRICDQYNQDSGTFYQTDLFLTELPTDFADLSLTKAVSDTAPEFGDTINYTLSLTNSGVSAQTATPEVTDLLPTGVNYVSHSGPGTYDEVTGIWAPGAVSIGQTVQLTITVTVDVGAGAPITNSAEITLSDRPDLDSTPNNADTGEDDYDDVTFTVSGTRVAGTPPTLSCPDGFVTFDWAGRSWPQGSTANNYTLAGFGSFDWSLSSPAGFMNIASLGGQHPVLTNAAQNQTTLSKAIDFNNRDEFATTTITLGDAVDGAQFVIFDVDFGTGDFADRVKVYGTFNGSTVIPVLTNGLSNYVIGNEAFGDQPAASNDANGNVTVTFSDPVDTIIVEYGNHSIAPQDPDGQAIQMKGGIVVCAPEADLVVLKSSTLISDPVNGTVNPKAIPNALLRYCILLTNTGASAARNVDAIDNLPGDITFQPGTIKTGTTCATANTSEDDDDLGADESDPAGASFNAGVLGYTHTAVNGQSSAAVTFEALIN